jgi:hypothetical protein
VNLNLDHEQSELLRDVLDERYRQLRSEITDSSVTAYKHQLRQRRGLLLSVLDLVGGPLPDKVR